MIESKLITVGSYFVYMKKIYIISVGDPLMCHLAVALKKKGYEVCCSGENIGEDVKAILQEENLMPEQEGWFPERLSKEIGYVVPSISLPNDNPELIRAYELRLLVLDFTEFLFRQAKDKTRVVVTGDGNHTRLLSIILFALKKQNLQCDYIGLNEIPGYERPIKLSYDARIILFQVDRMNSRRSVQGLECSLYCPHILLHSKIQHEEFVRFLTIRSSLDFLRDLTVTIERDGKYIFSEDDEGLELLSKKVREDITAIPYGLPTLQVQEGKCELVTRFGNYPLGLSDNQFLHDLSAARLTCRQLGVKDENFYEAASEYSNLF